MHLVRGEEKVFSDFSHGECSAAVLRDKRYYKISEAERATYKIIYKSAIAPNDAITVNNKVTPKQREALIALLTDPEAMKVARPIFNRFSRDAVAFDVADKSKFEDLDQLLLLGFGWNTHSSDSHVSENKQSDNALSTSAIVDRNNTTTLR